MKMYQGQQRPTPTEADRLNTTAVGSQELSGYSENNDRFVAQPDDYKRFTTHYLTRYIIVRLIGSQTFHLVIIEAKPHLVFIDN